MKISIIVAMGKKNQIGIDGKIPWRLKSDFKHFKETTMGGTLIMGRKTFESLPKGPLPGRTTIVLTRQKNYEVLEGVYIATHMYHALSKALFIKDSNIVGNDVWICGGAEVYKEGLKFADEMLISLVEWDGHADTNFPIDSWYPWNLESRTPYSTEITKDSLSWTLVKYKRLV